MGGGSESVDIEGQTVAFERRGDGPPLVLLHGAASDSRDWRRELDGLSDEFTVVAWDAPGCGHSFDPPDDYGLDGYADCLAAFVEAIVQKPEEYDEPTCGPGPFSMANADTVTDQLMYAGWENISLQRCDIEILGGNDLEQALDLVMSIGPAGEILRLQGDRAAHLVPQVEAALREGLAEYQRDDGSIWSMASTWIVTANAP